MERQIQFRGYNLKTKKWLYGYYLVNRGKHYIVQDEVVEPFSEPSDFEVDPESVGQYVGRFYECNVYEGDIIEYGNRTIVKIQSDIKTYDVKFIGNVMYNEQQSLFYIKSTAPNGLDVPVGCKYPSLDLNVSYYKVIGNEYEENIKSFQSIEKKVLDDWHKLDEEIFSKQHELIMENRKR